MKVTIELNDVTATVQDKQAITIQDALVLCAQALRGAGFYFKGELDIIDESDK